MKVKHVMPRSFLLLLCAVLAIPTAVPHAAAQQPGVRRTPGGVMLNFQDVDLSYVIASLAQVAGMNIVYSDLPQKNVTLRTAEPIMPEQVEALLRDLVASNGLTMSIQSGYTRIQGQAQGDAAPPRQLYIARLKHARAPVLAETLQTLFGGVIRANSAAQATSTLSQQLRQIELQNARARAGAPNQTQFLIPNLQNGELQDNVTIVPDEMTNSLLVRATPNDWQIVQQAVQALDLRPLQVVIEVVIAEVRRTNDLRTGLSFALDRTTDKQTTTGDLPNTAPADNFALRVIRAGNVNIDATLSALSTTGDVHILSRPIVVAQNNQEAYILVGSQQPFVQVSQSVPSGVNTLVQAVQYRDVGTRLTITPTINEDGYVNMAVTQEVSAATGATQFDAPVISTREAQTQLFARSGQTVVLGGLVDHQADRTRSGIPLLKDIPVLGYLFGSTHENESNSELFLFLTPYIVSSDEDADRLREEIESKVHLLEGVVPIVPLLPHTVRLVPDTTGTGGIQPR